MRLRIKILLPLAMLTSIYLHADDGNASIATGGLVVMGREPRITMAKEVLEISEAKVVVDYDFRNDSDQDITTEVAFPIPDYDVGFSSAETAQQGFNNFLLWVNGAPAHYRVEARAYLNGNDYTRLLTNMHVDVESFGHATSYDDSPDIQKLTPAQRKQLKQVGLIDKDGGGASWKVKKKFYWRQMFPAHKTVHIRHVYSPFRGNENSIHYGMGSTPDADSAEELKSFCIDSQLLASLKRIADSKDKDAPYSYVDFILTTANTWK
ncbi:MAG TPA: DUF4424 family protein, partial [Acidobacteriaceae bacterium]|nr:DUF4424 family protein [Acidobacteriaceae bacterium]